MAYFNHAFCKSWLAEGAALPAATATSAFTAGQFGLVDGKSWKTDTAANISAAGNLAYLVGGNYHPNDKIGNNPGHGGYQESIKSKGINFRYVSRLGVADSVKPKQAEVKLCVASDCAPCGQNLFVRLDVKGSPALRFLNHNAYAIGDSSGDAAANGGDLPGLCCVDGQDFLDPAMALAAAVQMAINDPIIKPFVEEGADKLNGVPATFTAGTTTGALTTGTYTAVATTTGGSGTGLTVTLVVDSVAGTAIATLDSAAGAAQGYAVGDSLTVAGDLVGGGTPADDITFDVDSVATNVSMAITTGTTTEYFTLSEVLNGGYTPSVDPVGAEVSACVTLNGAYVDTKFGNCSFDTRDHYEKEPVSLIASLLDETGNPCNDCGVATSTPGLMAQTSGETVVRSLILSDRYMQNPYNQGNADSSRIREIEGSSVIRDSVNRSTLYKVFYLQHSVPRFNNPSGVFDNDQYLYEIFVTPGSAADTNLTAMWAAISAQATALGNVVPVETGL